MKNEFTYLKWTNKVNIGILTNDIKKRNWIKSQHEFARLFDNTDKNHKVHCNMQYKYEVSFLLFRLKEEHFFYPVYSKGYFSFAEQHIVDYSENFLPNNTLKYISSKIFNNPDKYFVIINEVENIIKEITLCSKQLFYNYSK